MKSLRTPIRGVDIAHFFDEVQEEYLTPFDWVPNEHLPSDNVKKTIRLKDFFLAKYRERLCIYPKERIDDIRVEFHMIFADNQIIIYQAHGEAEKLKKMAEAVYYNHEQIGDKTVTTSNTGTDSSTDSTTNKGTKKMSSGQLGGQVDAVQLGSDLLDPALQTVDVSKLTTTFDKNVRQYSQAVNVDEAIDDFLVTNVYSDNSSSTSKGSQHSLLTHRNQALNEIKAHSLVVRRLREEFLQLFDVLFV